MLQKIKFNQIIEVNKNEYSLVTMKDGPINLVLAIFFI